MQVRDFAHWLAIEMKINGGSERLALEKFHYLRGFQPDLIDRVERDLALAVRFNETPVTISTV